MTRTHHLLALVTFASWCTAGCAYHSPTAPTAAAVPVSLDPATLSVVAATRADHALDVTATVRTRAGVGVPQVAVAFTSTAGTIAPPAALTDDTGAAHAVLTTAETSRLTATAGALTETIAVMGTPVPVLPTPTPIPEDPTRPTAPLAVGLSASAATLGASTVLTAAIAHPAVGPLLLTWTFGDGQTGVSLGPSTAHTYAAIGSYPVSVSVRDGAGRTAGATTTATVTAAPAPPTVTPPPTYGIVVTAVPPHVAAGGSVVLTATVTPLFGAPPPVSFTWECLGGVVGVVTTTPSVTCSNYTQTTTAYVIVSDGGHVGSVGSVTITVP